MGERMECSKQLYLGPRRVETATINHSSSLSAFSCFSSAARLICLFCQSAALSLFVRSSPFLTMKLAGRNLINVTIFQNLQYRRSGKGNNAFKKKKRRERE